MKILNTIYNSIKDTKYLEIYLMKDIKDLYRENIERLKRPYGESRCVHELKAQISVLRRSAIQSKSKLLRGWGWGWGGGEGVGRGKLTS